MPLVEAREAALVRPPLTREEEVLDSAGFSERSPVSPLSVGSVDDSDRLLSLVADAIDDDDGDGEACGNSGPLEIVEGEADGPAPAFGNRKAPRSS